MSEKLRFQWDDPFFFESQLSEEERLVKETARNYAQEKLMPRVLGANREERFDRDIFFEMGELGFFGITQPENYGGADLNYVSYGLVNREIERVDSGYRSMMSVQSSSVAARKSENIASHKVPKCHGSFCEKAMKPPQANKKKTMKRMRAM